MPNFQNNFATNLTSSTSASDTTSPLNSIPTVAAPFYLAMDATNINGNYEVVLVTSKTATNVNHAALANSHTTSEEVRMVVPAAHLNATQNIAEGQMINGKISVADTGGITVSLKTLAGTDPSVSDPVYINIGGTIRTISTALSVAKADGTNWCNAGSAELATKEIDYFVYLGYNATDGVTIGFSRIPGANQYSDFSVTTTNEKYCAISTITTAAATDYYENIGRFAATLSAGAGYTWTVPTFTASNLIQRPIFETRWLTWQPVYGSNGSMTYTSVTTTKADYKLQDKRCTLIVSTSGTTGGSAANGIQITLPFSSPGAEMSTGCTVRDATTTSGQAFFGWSASTTNITFLKYDYSNYGIGATRNILATGILYQI